MNYVNGLFIIPKLGRYQLLLPLPINLLVWFGNGW